MWQDRQWIGHLHFDIMRLAKEWINLLAIQYMHMIRDDLKCENRDSLKVCHDLWTIQHIVSTKEASDQVDFRAKVDFQIQIIQLFTHFQVQTLL